MKTRQSRWLSLIVLLYSIGGIVSTSTAQPSASMSILPVGINLVGNNGATPAVADPAGVFLVKVRDACDAPVPGCDVYVRFPATSIYSISSYQNYPGVTQVTCSPQTVHVTADASGIATFDIEGVLINPVVPAPQADCMASIYVVAACGDILLGSRPVAAFNLDGCNGVTASDRQIWDCDLASFSIGTYYACRSDFSHDGVVSGADLSMLVGVLYSHTSLEDGPRCLPGGPACDPPVVYNTPGIVKLEEANLCETDASYHRDACDPPTASAFTEYIGTIKLPPGLILSRFDGVEADIRLTQVNGGTLDPNYRFDALGCHRNGCTITSPTGDGECMGSTYGASGAVSLAGEVKAYWPDQGDQSKELLRVISFPDAFFGDLYSGNSGIPIPLFGIRINHSHPACSRPCATPAPKINIELLSIKLTAATSNVVLCPRAWPLPSPNLLGSQTVQSATSTVLVYNAQPGDSNIVVVGETTAAVGASELPVRVWLSTGGPNPSSGTTSIRFGLPSAVLATVSVYDLSGRKVRGLADQEFSAGVHDLAFDGRDQNGAALANGMYFCRLRIGESTQVTSIVVRR